MQATVSSAGASLRATFAVLLVAVVCGARCDRPVPAAPAAVPAARWVNLDPQVRYVGKQECVECHQGINLTFSQTGMGRAYYPLTAQNAVEDFSRNNEIEVGAGVRYRMERRGDKFFMRQFLRDARGQETAVQEHELYHVIGSNNHSRSYIIVVDGRFFQAPICWYPLATKWDLCPGYEHENHFFSREVSSTCVFCHNARMELVEGERNVYKEPIRHGIDCERCHGPAEQHVVRWRRGDETPTGERDETIVNPQRLAARERIQVCLQCHLGDSLATERVIRKGVKHGEFKPGLLLTDHVMPFRYRQASRSDFGISAQGDRLLLSRCYQASGGKLECLTCHNPHVSVYSPELPGDLYRKKCLSCHAVEDCRGPAPARQQTKPVADNCVTCHMRRAEPDDQRHADFTDHWIRRSIDVAGHEPRTDFELVPVFPEALAAVPAGEREYYWARAYQLFADKAPTTSARAGMWERSEQYFRQALERGFDNADSRFFLGKVLRERRQLPEALEQFRAALRHDPTHHDAMFALGQGLLATGQLDEARQLMQRLLERDPDDPMALSELGRLKWLARQPDQALADYDRALAVEPWTATLHLNRGMVLASVNRFDAATADVERAMALDPASVPLWEFYTNLLLHSGQSERAAEARRRWDELRRPAP